MQHIIIGAGPAGVVAAETIRKYDSEASITIIGDEPEPPYSRMAIPYYLIKNIDESGSYLRDPVNHYRNLNIELVQMRVDQVDATNKQVKLADGRVRSYDKLLVATGSRPVNPPILGLDLPQVHSCWTLKDARGIAELAQPGANVVLIGAGFIGCIILEALVRRGINLSVIETGNRMVPRMLNEKAGGLLKQWCLHKGIDVHTSCSVQSVTPAENGVSVSLSDGDALPAALVITATGVKSNLEMLEGSGIEVDQGIVVNNQMQTSHSDIYAAGDVAQGMDFSTGKYEVQAIQPTATDHGRIAGMNMAGKAIVHHGTVNMNVLDTVGLISCSFGLWMGIEGGEQAELYSPDQYQYVNLQFDDHCLIGASCVGKTQHIGVLRGLIESKITLGVWRKRLLGNPNLIMEAYMACTQELGYNQKL
jgi:NAD(P)H-nitrite reductase large subunit